MKEKKNGGQPAGRRLRQKVDGPIIEKWYARMPTAELARRMGLTVKQIENYVYRHNTEPWARKLPSVRSAMNSEKVDDREKWKNKKLTLFFFSDIFVYLQRESGERPRSVGVSTTLGWQIDHARLLNRPCSIA